ncbi:hypothetical protein GBA52_008648 [Prunus armeniaca]|nr:hypothetical protein GBA52_008648 [Prunus armeniaca]
MEQLKTIGQELAMGSQGGFGQSKEFMDLVKSIGEARFNPRLKKSTSSSSRSKS